jgi:hypothetical protein
LYHPVQPPGNPSLLARHLGSEAAAEAERRAIRRRQRGDALRCRQLAEAGTDSAYAAELLSLRAEVRRLRDGYAEVRRLRTELDQLRHDELPEALAYLNNGRHGT